MRNERERRLRRCLAPKCLGLYESVSCSVTSDSLKPHELQPTRLLCPWNSPGKNTGVGSHSLLQGIFPTQCRQILYLLSHQRSPFKALKEDPNKGDQCTESFSILNNLLKIHCHSLLLTHTEVHPVDLSSSCSSSCRLYTNV